MFVWGTKDKKKLARCKIFSEMVMLDIAKGEQFYVTVTEMDVLIIRTASKLDFHE